jgi:hypothetical protein
MSTHFRRSRKIAPGVRANVTKSGLSVSFGMRGARTTIGKRGITRTYGVPGTGAYQREFTSWEKLNEDNQERAARKAAERAELNEIFADQPLPFTLSLLCLVLAILVFFIPELSWWWLVPAIIGGISFFIVAIDRHERKVMSTEEEYTTIHITTFLKKYTPVMCNELFTALQSAQAEGNEYVDLTTSTITELDALLSPE